MIRYPASGKVQWLRGEIGRVREGYRRYYPRGFEAGVRALSLTPHPTAPESLTASCEAGAKPPRRGIPPALPRGGLKRARCRRVGPNPEWTRGVTKPPPYYYNGYEMRATKNLLSVYLFVSVDLSYWNYRDASFCRPY